MCCRHSLRRLCTILDTKIEEDGAHSCGFIDHVLALSEWDDDVGLDSDSSDIFEDGNEIPGWYEVDDKEFNALLQMVDLQ